MSIIAQDLVREVARNTGGYIQSVATSVGSAATDVNDTQLNNHTISPHTFKGKWWEAQSDQNSGEVRRITESTTTDLTIVAAGVATPVGTRYAIYDNNPAEILIAVNQAIKETGTALYEHVLDENTIMDDLSKNPSFEDSRPSIFFDSSDNSVAIAADSSINDITAEGFALVVWVFPLSVGEGNQGSIIDKMGSDDKGFRLYVTDQVGNFMQLIFQQGFSGSGNQKWFSGGLPIEINRWNRIAVTYNAGTVAGGTGLLNNPLIYHSFENEPLRQLSTYIDVGTPPSGNLEAETNTLYIGNNNGGSATWDGLISDVQLFNQERSVTQFEADLDEQDSGIPEDTTLAGRWISRPGSANSQTAISDRSGNRNVGSLDGGAIWYEAFNHWRHGGTQPATSLRVPGLNDKKHGSQAAELTAASGGAAQYRQSIDTQNTSVGATLVHKRWVRADGTDRARIGIGGTNVTTTYSDYHPGNSQWELLTIEYFLEANDEDIFILCESATSQVGKFDLGWASIKDLTRYELPDGMRRPTSVTQQRIENSPAGDFLALEGVRRRHGAILRIEGQRPLPELSSPNDVLPLDSRYAPILVEKASAILKGYMVSRASGDRREELLADQRTHQIAYEDLVRSPRTRMPRLVTEITKAWKTEGNELVLIP